MQVPKKLESSTFNTIAELEYIDNAHYESAVFYREVRLRIKEYSTYRHAQMYISRQCAIDFIKYFNVTFQLCLDTTVLDTTVLEDINK